MTDGLYDGELGKALREMSTDDITTQPLPFLQAEGVVPKICPTHAMSEIEKTTKNIPVSCKSVMAPRTRVITTKQVPHDQAVFRHPRVLNTRSHDTSLKKENDALQQPLDVSLSVMKRSRDVNTEPWFSVRTDVLMDPFSQSVAPPQSPVMNPHAPPWRPKYDRTLVANDRLVIYGATLQQLDEATGSQPNDVIKDQQRNRKDGENANDSLNTTSDEGTTYLEAMKSLATAASLPRAELMNFDGSELSHGHTKAKVNFSVQATKQEKPINDGLSVTFKKLCDNCLSRLHFSAGCKRRKACTVVDCDIRRKHIRLIQKAVKEFEEGRNKQYSSDQPGKPKQESNENDVQAVPRRPKQFNGLTSSTASAAPDDNGEPSEKRSKTITSFEEENGLGLPSSSTGSRTTRPGGTGLSFAAYKELKERERGCGFKGKGRKKKQQNIEVTIQIGIMQLKDGELKVVRGASLPLKVNQDINHEDLIVKAKTKVAKFHQNHIQEIDPVVLLYPDRSEGNGLSSGKFNSRLASLRANEKFLYTPPSLILP
eukprot:gene7647-8487_t